MLPDQVSNPGPLTYESGALPIALRCPAGISKCFYAKCCNFLHKFEQRLSYIARACVEKCTVLENGSNTILAAGTTWYLHFTA